MPTTGTEVTAHIEGWADEASELIFSVAVAHGPQIDDESLTCTVAGQPIEVAELITTDGTRLHKAVTGSGQLILDYRAMVSGQATPAACEPSQDVVYRRPSRYCESDKLGIIGAKLFAGLSGQELVNEIVSWVNTNLHYVPGSSGPTDGAVDTYLAQEGVCRDFAHLTIALLRACGLPARLVSVYAPGLRPMDFHAVAEVCLDGTWQVVDATRLAPRPSMIRIATGRDASDTAFITTHTGGFRLSQMQVTVYRYEGLPSDNFGSPVSI